MEKFYPYWRFFCSRTFAKDDKLHFYEDGAFAIMTNTGVSLYSEEAKPVCHYGDAFLLPNGCICQHKENEIFVYFKRERLYSIPCSLDTKFLVRENTIEIEDAAGKRDLFFIAPQLDDKGVLALSEKGLTVEGVSPDNKVLVHVTSNTKAVVDKNGKIFHMGHYIDRVDFLGNGSFIVHGSNRRYGSCLYNSDKEPVLEAVREYGILPLGDCVRYENALIADANGLFIGEYNGEAAVYADIHIFTYKVMRTGAGAYDTHFWPGGEMMGFYNPYLGWVLCYWRGGHFYFAPQDVSKCMDEFYAYLHVHLDAQDHFFRHYMNRIKEIVLVH